MTDPIQANDQTAESSEAVRGVPPWRLALLRLIRHRLAMIGLALDLGIVLLVLGGGCLVDTVPQETRLWVGAQPPGFCHPHCPDEILFQIGEPTRLTGAPADCSRLRYVTRERVVHEVRIAVRRGRIRSITDGPRAIERLDLASIDSPVHELLEDGSLGRLLPRVVVVAGEEPPQGLFSSGQRVLFAAWEEPAGTTIIDVGVGGGKVSGIQVGEEEDRAVPVETAVIRGEDVVEVLGDGQPLVLRHPLGTDELGRDLLLRIVAGGRVSLLVACVASGVSLVVGIAYGSASGYFGGRTDAIMMRFVDTLYGLPFIFLVLLLMVVFDRNIILLFAALGLVQWLTMARIVRGQVLSLKRREFIEAARMGGASTWRIVTYHLLPHLLGPVVVYTTLTVPVVILEESFLAFIGLPVQYQGTTLDSWGSLVHLGMSAFGEGGQKWWLLCFPSLAMVLTLFGLNCLGDGLRDSLDPKTK